MRGTKVFFVYSTCVRLVWVTLVNIVGQFMFFFLMSNYALHTTAYCKYIMLHQVAFHKKRNAGLQGFFSISVFLFYKTCFSRIFI